MSSSIDQSMFKNIQQSNSHDLTVVMPVNTDYSVNYTINSHFKKWIDSDISSVSQQHNQNDFLLRNYNFNGRLFYETSIKSASNEGIMWLKY